MDHAKKPRHRAPNFTTSESLHFCQILENYKDIIDCKKTDGPSLHEKHKAWLKVAEQYNTTTTTYSRTVESLQQCYKNMKKKYKKQLSESNMDSPVSDANVNDTVCDKLKTLAGEKMDLVSLQKELISKQLQMEEEKLAQTHMQTDLLQAQIIEQEEKFAHNRTLRTLELEELTKKAEHNELLRKIEIENLTKKPT